VSPSYPERPESSDPLAREPLSPELVLVDPVLASFARKRLPDIGDSLARPARRQAPDRKAPAAAGRPAQDSAAAADSSGRLGWARALAVLTVLVLFGGVFAWRALRGSGDASVPVAAGPAVSTRGHGSPTPPFPSRSEAGRPKPAAKNAAAGTGTAPGARRRPALTEPALAAPVFLWPSVRGARFYQVEIFRKRGKIFQAVARKPRLQLPLHWSFRGRAFTLTPGRYSWQVRPAVGFGRSLRFGKPIIQSSWLFRSSSR